MRAKHFDIRELVTPQTFKLRGDSAWALIDVNLILTIDQLRAHFGPLTCNNWHSGGNRHLSGLRPHDTTTGAQFSQHKFGRAADLLGHKFSADEMRAEILKRPELFPHLRCIEKDVSWLHVDVRNHNAESQILIVSP